MRTWSLPLETDVAGVWLVQRMLGLDIANVRQGGKDLSAGAISLVSLDKMISVILTNHSPIQPVFKHSEASDWSILLGDNPVAGSRVVY